MPRASLPALEEGCPFWSQLNRDWREGVTRVLPDITLSHIEYSISSYCNQGTRIHENVPYLPGNVRYWIVTVEESQDIDQQN